MDRTKIIKVFEGTQTKCVLDEQEKQDILAIRDLIGDNNLILQADGKLLVNHYTGFIQMNKTRLLIYPKIARRVRDDSLFDKAFEILVKMLVFTDFIQVKHIAAPQSTGLYKGDILELMIGIFVNELLLLFKKDINRSYSPVTENETFIRGKINFTENIKRNSYRHHLHLLEYEQFTENILMNRIFKSVILNLLLRTTVKENKIKLRQALLWLEDVDQIKLTSNIWDQVVFTRLNHRYKTVFNMAKIFYNNSSVNLNKGDELTFSFLVPVNGLFEYMVYKLLYDAAFPDVNVQYQKTNRYLGTMNGQSSFLLIPDICLVRNNDVLMIFDAKYKEVFSEEGNIRLSQDDIYQMLAYSIRYNCNQIVLVYPKMLGAIEDKALLCDIKIPKNDSVLTIKVIQIDLEDDIKELVSYIKGYISSLLRPQS